MATATLTSKGQTTIPKEVRDHLHLHPGDKLEFIIEADGGVVVRSVSRSVTELEGVLPKPSRPVSLEAMEQAIRKRR